MLRVNNEKESGGFIYGDRGSTFFTLLAGLGIINNADRLVADFIYQRPKASEGQIVLIGIDQKALDNIDPYSQWGRDVFEKALEILNVSEKSRPTVIGLDIIFEGETTQEADAALTEAAERYDNVATATAAEFGSSPLLIANNDNNDYNLDTFSVLSYDEPYPSLHSVTAQGHVNAMLDSDGILRHSLLTVRLSDEHLFL